MGGIAPKRKGNSAERELCALLSQHLGGSFLRSNNSGAFIGGANAHRRAGLSAGQVSACAGDIVPPDNLRHLIIEVKSYADLRWHQLLVGRCAQMDAWLAQLEAARHGEGVGLLCFKLNRQGWFVAVSVDHATASDSISHLRYVTAGGTYLILELEPFLASAHGLTNIAK